MGVKSRPGGGGFGQLSCYERHRKLLQDYIQYYGGSVEDLMPKAPAPTVTDLDVLRENYRFLPTPDDYDDSTSEKRMAKKYFDKLYKEYCVGYLNGYREGKVGMRWRTKQEVLRGKGQFICGHSPCDKTDKLRSYEVKFSYREAGERKLALVKLRVCPECAYKLNYKRSRRISEAAAPRDKKKKRKKKKKAKKAKKRRSLDGEESGKGLPKPKRCRREVVHE